MDLALAVPAAASRNVTDDTPLSHPTEASRLGSFVGINVQIKSIDSRAAGLG
jgi:hypothetical protein